jgi:hypothetical protein
VEGVEQRPLVGIDLGHQISRQEAQALPGLDRRPRQDDPVDLVAGERRSGHRDRQERLARASRSDPEGDRVLAQRVHITLLVDRLRCDAEPAVMPDDVLEDARRRLVRVERAGHRADRPGADLMAAGDQL